MSPFFQRSSPFADLASSVQPLLNLFDEELTGAACQPIRSFQPRFDVREDETAFHLQGELPGIDQENINIEFKDEHTLVVSGRTVRERTQASEGDVKGKGKAIEAEAAAPETGHASDSETGSNYHKPTVEDDNEEFVDVASESNTAATPATAATEVAKSAEPQAPAKQQQPSSRYWVNERSVGEFRRSFTFAGHVNQDAVTASLNNGLLNITVPKATPMQPRRIAVQ